VIGGLIANRVRGVYFALITFGMAQVVAKIVYNTRELGASDGMIGIPVIDIGFGAFSVSAGSPVGFFIVVLATIMLLYAVTAYLLDTPFGRVLTAIKANEKRVPFLGYSVWQARMACYVLAVVLGGVGTLIGAIYGSVLLIVLKSFIGSWTEHHLIVIGLLFIAGVMFMPKGIIGLVRPHIEAMLLRRSGIAIPVATPSLQQEKMPAGDTAQLSTTIEGARQ
jgi:branched-chain amino acid transport system permease protein